jgi:sn-glycerol 3-phosphate transport system permease protein
MLMSVRPPNEPLNQGNLLIGSHLTLNNFQAAWRIAPWPTHYLNSLIFAFGTLAVQFITITLAGYAFARLRFAGRGLLLTFVLLQILVPNSVLIAQNFVTVRDLGFYNTLVGMMLLYWGSAFGTLLLRQTFRSIPYELEEAARMDGANLYHVLRHVYVPLSIPAYIAFALVSVSSHWNEFLWPLIITKDEEVRPLTVGLNKLVQSAEVGALYHQQMAGTLLVIAPLTLLFMVFQRRFIESFAQSGIK